MNKIKFEILYQMNEYAKNNFPDDWFYDRWCMIVPDEASTEDIEDMVQDEELWVLACQTFGDILKELNPNNWFSDVHIY